MNVSLKVNDKCLIWFDFYYSSFLGGVIKILPTKVYSESNLLVQGL